MNLGEELAASREDFLAASNAEIRESGSRLTPVERLSLHLWSESCNVIRRVLAIADQTDERLALGVERFARPKPDRLVIMRRDYARSPRELSRSEHCEQLRRILAEQFPDETLENISITADLEHSLSKIYARGNSRRGAALFGF
jgi:hypothetical protein